MGRCLTHSLSTRELLRRKLWRNNKREKKHVGEVAFKICPSPMFSGITAEQCNAQQLRGLHPPHRLEFLVLRSMLNEFLLSTAAYQPSFAPLEQRNSLGPNKKCNNFNPIIFSPLQKQTGSACAPSNAQIAFSCFSEQLPLSDHERESPPHSAEQQLSTCRQHSSPHALLECCHCRRRTVEIPVPWLSWHISLLRLGFASPLTSPRAHHNAPDVALTTCQQTQHENSCRLTSKTCDKVEEKKGPRRG